jgi:hypothetical protein
VFKRRKLSGYVLKPRQQINETHWQTFLKKHDSRELFTDWRIQDALSKWNNLENRSWAVLDDRNEINAIFAFQEYKTRYSKWFRKINLFYVSEIPLITLLVQIKVLLSKEKRINLLRIHTKTRVSRKTQLRTLAFFHRRELYRILELNDEYENIFYNYRKSTKHLVKKGNTRFQMRVGGYRDLDLYYRQHIEHRNELNLQPIPYSYFERLFSYPSNGTFLTAIFVEEKGVTVSSALFVAINRSAYYLSGNSKRNYAGSSHSSIDYFIKLARQNQLQDLNLGKISLKHAQSKSGGISKFKRGFGGVDSIQYVYFVVI